MLKIKNCESFQRKKLMNIKTILVKYCKEYVASKNVFSVFFKFFRFIFEETQKLVYLEAKKKLLNIFLKKNLDLARRHDLLAARKHQVLRAFNPWISSEKVFFFMRIRWRQREKITMQTEITSCNNYKSIPELRVRIADMYMKGKKTSVLQGCCQEKSKLMRFCIKNIRELNEHRARYSKRRLSKKSKKSFGKELSREWNQNVFLKNAHLGKWRKTPLIHGFRVREKNQGQSLNFTL